MIKSRIVIILLSLLTISNLFGQSEFKDSVIIGLSKKSDFKAISKYAISKMNETQIMEHKLYYNNSITQSFFSLHSYDTAKIYAINGLKMINLVDDSNLICKAWYQAGLVYFNFNKFDSSLHYIFKSLNCANNNNFTKIKAKANNLIGILMNANNNKKSAINFFEIACKQYLEINDTFSYSSSLLNLGYAQFSSGDSIHGIINLKKSIKHLEKFNKYYDMILAYLSITEYYLDMKNFNEFNRYINLATETAKRIDDKESLARCYFASALGCVVQLDYNGAINYATKARNTFNQNNLSIDSVLSIAYEGIGDHPKALEYQKLYVKNYKKFIEKVQTEKLNKLAVELNLSEKDSLIENQKLDLNNRKNEFKISLAIIGLISLFFLSVIVFFYLKNKHKNEVYSNLLIKEKELKEEREYFSRKSTKIKNNLTINTILENKNGDLAKEDHHILYLEMQDLFEKKKIHLDANLRIEDIIKELGTNKTYLYAAMKFNTEDNFRVILNKYRVEEAKSIINNLINENKKIVIEDIQLNAGFNSTVSFFRAFKTHTGLTPMEFVEQTKNHKK